jgi:CheY-like chemotaxis protein
MITEPKATDRSAHRRAVANLAWLDDRGNGSEFLRSFRHTLRNRAAILHGALEIARLDGVDEAALRDVACVARTFDDAIAELDLAFASATGTTRTRAPAGNPAQAAADEESPGDEPLRVMVADDEPDIRSTLAEMLRTMGHDVRTASDGEAALTLARQWQPDVVLLDVFMPRMSGFVVARLLRLQFERAKMRIVMMSGYPLDEDTLENAGEAGFDACLDKTFTIELLKQTVTRNPPWHGFGPDFTSG